MIKTFSDAVPVLAARGMEIEQAGSKLWKVGSQTLDKGGVIALARQLAERDATQPVALSPLLQEIARQYIAARKKSGEALLEMAKHMAAAREAARHGEWGLFLESTQTSQDWAERLLTIHAKAQTDVLFAEAVRTNFLSPTVAGLLARESTPPQIVDAAFHAAEPPTKRQIEQEIRESKIRTGAENELAPATPAAPFWQALSPAHPTAHLWTRERPDLWRAACGVVKENRAPQGSMDGGHCSNCVRATWKETPAIHVAFRHSRDRHETDLDDGLMRALESVGYMWESATITPDGRWHHLIRSRDTNLQRWQQIRLRRERLEALLTVAPAEPSAAPLSTPATCVRCGADRTERRELTSYEAGLVPEYGGRAVTLCNRCIPELLRARAAAAAPTLAELDSSLPKDLEKAGYFWQSAAPPVIAHNDGWRGDARTVESALSLAYDRLRAAPVAPTRLTCPTCGEIIMNGIWGDLKECGECYHARAARPQTAPSPSAWQERQQTITPAQQADEAFYIRVEQLIVGILEIADHGSLADVLTAMASAMSALAPADLTSLAEQLDDATYEALAAYRRDRSVPTLDALESEARA